MTELAAAGGLRGPSENRVEIPARNLLDRALGGQSESGRAVARGWHHRLGALVTWVDAAMITVALVVTYGLRFGAAPDTSVAGSIYLNHELVAVAFGGVWMLALAAKETRRTRILGAGLEEYRRVLSASLQAFGALAILSYFIQADVSRLFFVTTLPLGVLLLLAGRWVIRNRLTRARLAGRAATSTLVVGDEPEVRSMLTHLRRNPGAGYRPHSVCLTDEPHTDPHRTQYDGLPVVQRAELEAFVESCPMGAIVIAGGVSPRAGRRLAWRLENTSTELLYVPCLTDVAGPRLSLREAAGLDLIHVELPRYNGAKYWLKRSFDFVFAAAALLLLSPVFAAIAAAIKLGDGGPVLFTQTRVGHKGRPFEIHKFRTMHLDAEARLEELRSESMGDGPLFKMADDPRVTRVGRFLRTYSLDELPQFWTVLLGDMSIVGPRPHLAQELADFPNDGLRRLLIKPGVTGLWQVSGRSDLSLEDSIRLDLRYVENWSLPGDIAIILKTVRMVLRPSGAY